MQNLIIHFYFCKSYDRNECDIVCVEMQNLKTGDTKIIYSTKTSYNYCYNIINISNMINGNIFFNLNDGSEPDILFHYNVYMDEGKYEMGSKLSAFDINQNILATCLNNRIQAYNLC